MRAVINKVSLVQTDILNHHRSQVVNQIVDDVVKSAVVFEIGVVITEPISSVVVDVPYDFDDGKAAPTKQCNFDQEIMAFVK